MDLSFHLSIAPGLFQRGPHRRLLSFQSRREPSQFRCGTVLRSFHPAVEFLRPALPEDLHELPRQFDDRSYFIYTDQAIDKALLLTRTLLHRPPVTLYLMRRMSTLPPDLLYQNTRINRKAVRKQETLVCLYIGDFVAVSGHFSDAPNGPRSSHWIVFGLVSEHGFAAPETTGCDAAMGTEREERVGPHAFSSFGTGFSCLSAENFVFKQENMLKNKNGDSPH